MKNIQDIKDEYAREVGFDDWNEIEYSHTGDEISHHWNIVTKRFAIEVARETLKNAAENAMLIYTHYMSSLPTVAPKYTVTEHSQGVDNRYDVVVYKHSIRDENNIPEL